MPNGISTDGDVTCRVWCMRTIVDKETLVTVAGGHCGIWLFSANNSIDGEFGDRDGHGSRFVSCNAGLVAKVTVLLAKK